MSCIVLRPRPCFVSGCRAFGLKIAASGARALLAMTKLAGKPGRFANSKVGAAQKNREPTRFPVFLLILESVKKLEELFIAPTARQILHETAQRACARCECA